MADGIRKHNPGIRVGAVGCHRVRLVIPRSVGCIGIWTDAVIMGILIFFTLNSLFIVDVGKSKTNPTVTHGWGVAGWRNPLRKFFTVRCQRKHKQWRVSLHGYHEPGGFDPGGHHYRRWLDCRPSPGLLVRLVVPGPANSVALPGV